MIDAMLSANGLKMEDLMEFHFNKNASIEKKTEEKNLAGFRPLKPNQKWGDLSESEDEEDEYPTLSNSTEKEEKPAKGSWVKVVASNTVLVETKEMVKQETMEGFKTAQKKKKQELPVIYSVEEFIEEIRAGRKPNTDFVIDDSAHCEHTYAGTLCPDVRACGAIHLQRCTFGEDCYKKRCPFLHSWDMLDGQAEESFKRTMRKYNVLKQGKKVAM